MNFIDHSWVSKLIDSIASMFVYPNADFDGLSFLKP